MEIIFSNPLLLWFLLSIPLLVIVDLLSFTHMKRKALLFANFDAIARITKGQELSKTRSLLVMKCLVLLLLVLASAGPVVYYYGLSSESEFVLAIDASASMMADDYNPNRLEAAKNAALSFVEALPPKTKVGVLSFAGTSYVKQRLTEDTGEIKNAIQSIAVEPAGGTALGDAMMTSLSLFDESDRGRVIILLTDGRSNIGQRPGEALDSLISNDVTLNTIGVGTEEGGKFANVTITSDLDEDTLEKIAQDSGGKYSRAETEAHLLDMFKELAVASEVRISIDLSPFLMLGGLSLLILVWSLLHTRYRVLP